MINFSPLKPTSKPWENVSWPDLYFTAEAEQETFADVHVITTRADYADALFTQLVQRISAKSIPRPKTEQKIIERMLQIHNEGIVNTCEHVNIHNGNIKVVINVNEIDEAATYKALNYVARTLDRANGNDINVSFSSPFTYEAHELFWLFKQ